MKDFPHLQRNPTKLSFVACPVHGTKLNKIAVVNSFSSMWLEINSALAAERQRPSQWQAQPEASTKTKDKRDLCLSAMIAVAPLFLHWKIGLSTHTESRCDARRFIDASKAACGSDLQFLWRIRTSAFPRVPPAKGNRRCLRFQTPDLQLQIQDEDLTYV